MEDEAELTGATPRRRPKPDVLEIAGHKLHPATLMMGHGYDPALSEGSLKPPVFLTSTFVFENAAAGKRFFEGVTGKRGQGTEAAAQRDGEVSRCMKTLILQLYHYKHIKD